MNETQMKNRNPESYQRAISGAEQRHFDGERQTRDISPTQRSIETLDKEVSVLIELLTKLSQRLAVVTRPQVECTQEQEGSSAQCSPLVDRINSIGTRIERLTRAVQAQLELLEI